MYYTFEHEADIGIKGEGKTIEEAFQETAKAMFSVMANLEKVGEVEKISGKTNGTDLVSLLVNWLNQLLAEKDIHSMILKSFKARIMHKNNGYEIEWEAKGEKMNTEKQDLKTEVKAATFHMAEVEEKNGEWTAQCIVDV